MNPPILVLLRPGIGQKDVQDDRHPRPMTFCICPLFPADTIAMMTYSMPWGYLIGRLAFPLAFKTGPNILSDTMFHDLKEMDKTTPLLTRSPRPQWMSSM